MKIIFRKSEQKVKQNLMKEIQISIEIESLNFEKTVLFKEDCI